MKVLPRFASATIALSVLSSLVPASFAQPPLAAPKPVAAVANDDWRKQFQAGTKPLGSAAATPAPKTGAGDVTFTLNFPKEPSPEDEKILQRIAKSVEDAAKLFNTHTRLKKKLQIYYNPGVPTADGNYNGSIRFGKTATNLRVAVHEMGHTMGVGQHRNWGKLMVNGVWQGDRANKLLQKYTSDPKAELHGDRMHFWPYGLNYDNELKSDEDLVRSVTLVEAMFEDMESAR